MGEVFSVQISSIKYLCFIDIDKCQLCENDFSFFRKIEDWAQSFVNYLTLSQQIALGLKDLFP